MSWGGCNSGSGRSSRGRRGRWRSGSCGGSDGLGGGRGGCGRARRGARVGGTAIDGHVGRSSLLLALLKDGPIARLVDALVELVGVPELALVLAGISVISSLKDGDFLGSGGSAGDLVIDARVVIAERIDSSEPSPLKSPGSVGKVKRDFEVVSASSRASVHRSSVSAVGIVSVIRSASSNFVASNDLNSSIECRVAVRTGGWRP